MDQARRTLSRTGAADAFLATGDAGVSYDLVVMGDSLAGWRLAIEQAAGARGSPSRFPAGSAASPLPAHHLLFDQLRQASRAVP